MEKNESIKKMIQDGSILGVIGVIIGLITYIIDVELNANLFYGLGLIAFTLVLVFVFAFRNRAAQGGYIEFNKAFLHSFGLLAVAGLIGTVFNLILFSVIDPDSVQVIADAAVENTEKWLPTDQMSDDDIDKTLADVETDTIGRFTAWGMVKQYLIGLIIYAVLSLIVGAVVKKKEQQREI